MKPGEIVYNGATRKGRSLEIRYINKGDEGKMMDYINTLSHERTFIIFQGESLTLEEERKYLDSQLKKLENNEAVQLLAFCEEKLVGISGVDMLGKAEKHVGSLGISVSKEYRGEGIGKLLMEQVLKEAEKNLPQLEIVTLGVFSNNDLALSMYNKFGFIQYGLLPKGIMHRGKHVDHIYMYKVIRSS